MSIPIVSALQFLLRPTARHANDASAAAELNVRQHALDLPPGLTVQWLGTAGFALGYQGHTILIDPYITRPRLPLVFSRRALRSNLARIERHVPAADAILVGHTHFDHALDIAAIAKLRGARVYGSRSTGALMGLHGLAAQHTEVEARRTYGIGPFEVTFIPSQHSKLALGLWVPQSGELTCEHLDELHGTAFRCGQMYAIQIRVAGVTIYHQGSANLLEAEVPRGGVDYFLCCIAGRGFTPQFTARALRALSPRVIIPQHHDDFFQPLDERMKFSLNVNFGGFVEEAGRVSRDFQLRTLEPLQVAQG
jgi:L-ascorbate metabolism protein UlaG (beta-lactamase superfamily)